ncbi:hypothetical protein BASA81_010065 [Batrachochytrium salamandrivorans]|nr:hypothetical protein BASA81_010065 [Batrachochytrium salamandrivorans]
MNELDQIYLGGTPRVSHQGQYEYALAPARSLSFERAALTKLVFTLAILGSLGLKIASLLVFFSRIEVSLVVMRHEDEHKVFSDFITDFSFPEMIRDFYNAEAYLMCGLIVLGSAAVPIAKHLFMLAVWWFPVPARWTPMRRRLLFLFDQTGKTALVDLFLIGYVICIFYTKLAVQLAGTGIQMRLQGEPVRGIFLAVASMFWGNFMSHYLLVVHDLQANGDFNRQVTVAVGPVSASLSNRLWIQMVPGNGIRNRAYHVAIPLLILFGMASLGMATRVELMSFQLAGLAGKIAGGEPREFTLLTAPQTMQASSQSYYGTLVLSVMHVALALVLPCCLLIASIVLWFVPIELRLQRRLLSYFPLWYSWCTLDMFVVTSIAAYLEMHLIAQFTFDKNFPTLCNGVERMAKLPCADLNQTLNWPGMLFCMAVCFVLLLLTVLVAVVGRGLLETEAAEDDYALVMDNPSLTRSPHSRNASPPNNRV